MMPHLVRAQSAYKDIRICLFHHARTHACTYTRTHTHTHTQYLASPHFPVSLPVSDVGCVVTGEWQVALHCVRSTGRKDGGVRAMSAGHSHRLLGPTAAQVSIVSLHCSFWKIGFV